MRKVISVVLLVFLLAGCSPIEPVTTETSNPNTTLDEVVNTEPNTSTTTPSMAGTTDTNTPDTTPSVIGNTESNTPDTTPSVIGNTESNTPDTTPDVTGNLETYILDFSSIENGNTDPKTLIAAYKAYYKLINSLIDDYGIGYNQGNDDIFWGSDLWWTVVYSGVVYAELIDFNNDGLSELLVIYNDGNTHFSDTWAIFGYSGNVELYYKMLFGFEGGSGYDAEIALSSNGLKYLVHAYYYYVNDDERDYSYYTVKDGNWYTALTRSVSITDESRQWDYHGDYQWQWMVNGELVGENEYETAPETELGITGMQSIPFYTRYQEDIETKNERASGFVYSLLAGLENRITQLATLVEQE